MPNKNNNIMTEYATNLQVNAMTNGIINLNKLNSLVGTTLALNSAVANIYGVDVKWFRSIPQERSKDILFLEWTLYNVEDCPLNLRVIYNDSGYDEASLTYNMMGIEYNIPLTMSISILDWQRETNNDGSTPSKGDIIYIPQSNRLYEVVSMTPEKTVKSQITTYKVNLQKYQPKRNVCLGDNLSNTIDNYTNGIEKLFGEEIKDEIMDIVNDKQTSPHNSTSSKDKYKKVYDNNSIIMEDIICDGHIIASGYYKNKSKYNSLVTYKVEDEVKKDDVRVFSCLFRLNYTKSNKKSTVKIDKLLNSNSNYHTYSVKMPIKSGKISIYNELFSLCGDYDDIKKELKIANKNVELLEEDWFNMESFDILSNNVNLITSDIFNINIIGNNTISVEINGKEYLYYCDFIFENSKWYNIVISLGKKTSLKIFSVNDKLNLLHSEEKITKKWEDFSNNNFEIKGNDIDLTNIRLYNTSLDDIEKYILNAITNFGNDDSKLLISDNAEAFFNNAYYGNQR